jgi:hypothetical protein
MTGEVGGLPYSGQAAFATRLEVPRAVRTWELLLVGSRFSVKGSVSFFSLNSTSYEEERTRRIKDLNGCSVKARLSARVVHMWSVGGELLSLPREVQGLVAPELWGKTKFSTDCPQQAKVGFDVPPRGAAVAVGDLQEGRGK